MAGSISGWIIIGIVVFVLLIIGGIVLPIVVPMMIGYTQGNTTTIQSGTGFFQVLANWWPLILPAVIGVAIVIMIMSRRGTGGGGSV